MLFTNYRPLFLFDRLGRYLKLFVSTVKVKCSFYIALSLDRSKRFTLFAFPDRPVHSDTNSASPGSIPLSHALASHFGLANLVDL